jgi:hypothetical protein
LELIFSEKSSPGESRGFLVFAGVFQGVLEYCGGLVLVETW